MFNPDELEQISRVPETRDSRERLKEEEEEEKNVKNENVVGKFCNKSLVKGENC